MGERLTKDYERAIREALASCRGEGRSWSWGNAGPFATVDETAEALAQVARNADGGAATNLWCVHMPDPNELGMSLYVCHTGNGPTSQAHARFFAAAPNAIRMLLAEIDALRDALRGLEAERMVAGGERPSTEATMSERLTKEREAEIRRVVDKMSFCPTPSLVRDLLAELDALRAAPPTTYLHADGTEEPIGELVARLTRERDGWRLRADDLTSQRDGQERDAIAARAEAGAERKARMALEARVRELLDAHAKLLDRLETAKARVRELEAERDDLRRLWDALDAERSVWTARAEKAEATLAETRAHLTGLWEAAGAVDEADASGDDTVLGVAIRHLRGVINADGPTLAEIRRDAQVEVLRDAAKEAARGEDFDDIDAPLRGDTLPGCVADWLRQRADELEAGRA